MTKEKDLVTVAAIHADLVRLAMEGVEAILRITQVAPEVGPPPSLDALEKTRDVFRHAISERMAQIAGPLSFDREMAVEDAFAAGVRAMHAAAARGVAIERLPDPELVIAQRGVS